jgi:hypothetical protein
MSRLLDLTAFTPHGFCLAWEPGLIWLTAGSNILIATAYFSIPAALAALMVRRRGIEYGSVLSLFAAFILACGATHVFAALTLWVPLYWISGITDAVTAALSIATAIILWPLIPKFVALPSHRALQKSNLQLQAAEAATAQANSWLVMSEQLAHVGHWLHARGSSVIIFSDELFRIFGLTNTNGSVPAGDIALALHAEDRDTFRQAMSLALREKSGFDVSVRLIRKSAPCRCAEKCNWARTARRFPFSESVSTAPSRHVWSANCISPAPMPRPPRKSSRNSPCRTVSPASPTGDCSTRRSTRSSSARAASAPTSR